jgi:hypothetical protein
VSKAGYSQNEVAAILKRAAQIETDGEGGLHLDPRGEVQAGGLSLDDLEHIAEDSGLNPSSVRAAARELDGSAPIAAGDTPAGRADRTVLQHRRGLDGELDEADLERLVQLTGTRLNLSGQATAKRDGWQWTSRWDERRLRVLAESRRGRTSIEVNEDLRGLLAALSWKTMGTLGGFGLAFGFVFGLNVESSVRGALMMAAIGTLTSLAAGFALSRLMFKSFRSRRDVQLQHLAAGLEHEARELLGETDVENRTASTEAEPSSRPGERGRDGDEGRPRKRSRSRD